MQERFYRLSNGTLVRIPEGVKDDDPDLLDFLDSKEVEINGRKPGIVSNPRASGFRDQVGFDAPVPVDAAKKATKTLTRAAPIAAGMALGGWPGVALAAGTGMAGQSARDAIDEKPQSLSRIAGEGAIEGGLSALSPIARLVGPFVKRGASAAMRGLTGIETKVGSDALMNSGRARFTAENVAELRKTAGKPGMPRADTVEQFAKAEAAANKPVTTISDADKALRFLHPNAGYTERMIRGVSDNRAHIGNAAARGANAVGSGMEGLGGGPATIARLIRLLTGGGEEQ